jgi:hypothetical protein
MLVTRINVDLPEALKARLVKECKADKRSQRDYITILLEERFAALDKEREREQAA